MMTWDLIFWHKVWYSCPERFGKFRVVICFSFGYILGNRMGDISPPTGRVLSDPFRAHAHYFYSFIRVRIRSVTSQTWPDAAARAANMTQKNEHSGTNPTSLCRSFLAKFIGKKRTVTWWRQNVTSDDLSTWKWCNSVLKYPNFWGDVPRWFFSWGERVPPFPRFRSPWRLVSLIGKEQGDEEILLYF